jgi:phenylacetate-CoA ligase
MLSHAYTVPLYREKYDAAGIHPGDIRGLQDIKRLPFITKEDLRNNFPNRVVSPSFQMRSAIVAATSGTTGRSLSLYVDLPTVIRSMLGFRRALLEHRIPWQKTRMSLLLDLSENSFENEYFMQSVLSVAKRILPMKQIQILSILCPPVDLIRQINAFEPEVILGYPFVIIQLAILKSRGQGERITPKWIGSSGAVFDSYSRRFVEEVFHTNLFDIYAATEAGIIAFECAEGRYHVCSDLVFLECLKNNDDAPFGQPGLLTVTKLYGKGTPLIRYQGIDDVVTFSPNDCCCGLAGAVLEKIHGRKSDSIVLPDGRIVLISVFEHCIGESLYEIKVNKIRRIQIVQNKIDSIEMKILFDDHLRDVHCSADETLSLIHHKLQDRLGPHLEIRLTEVEKFEDKAPYILSTMDSTRALKDNFIV